MGGHDSSPSPREAERRRLDRVPGQPALWSKNVLKQTKLKNDLKIIIIKTKSMVGLKVLRTLDSIPVLELGGGGA